MQLHNFLSGSTLLLLHLLSSTFASVIRTRTPQQALPLPVHVVHEFPKGTWVENLAVRQNDQILATILTAPEIYQVDPLGIVSPILVHTFTSTTGVTGIVETEPDIFYVATGNFSFATFTNEPGSWAIWKVDLRLFSVFAPATVTKVADFPQASLLNGLTLLDNGKGIVLAADSFLGVVWSLNVNTGQVAQLLADPLMKPTAVSSSKNGINGIKIRDGALFFTNSNTEIFARLPINKNGTAAGVASIVASGLSGDDFQFDNKGDAFVALNSANSLGFIAAGSTDSVVVLAGSQDSFVLAGPTACQFGRTLLDEGSLYVSSTGGVAAYKTGNFTVGGRISRIDVGYEGY